MSYAMSFKTIFNCFASEHSAFKTKHLKADSTRLLSRLPQKEIVGIKSFTILLNSRSFFHSGNLIRFCFLLLQLPIEFLLVVAQQPICLERMKYRFFVFFFFLGLTVARYLVIHYTKASLKRKQDSIKGFVFFLIHFLKKNMFSRTLRYKIHGFAFVPTVFQVSQILHGFYTDFTDLAVCLFFDSKSA